MRIVRLDSQVIWHTHKKNDQTLCEPGEIEEWKNIAMVLELDLYHLTLQQISEFVRRKCAQYGTVLSVSVKLFPLSTGHARSFAVIEMASPEENTKLMDSIGDGYKDKGVLVNLLHKDDD